MDAGLADLIEPAVLYADRVTIYSPTAALLHGVTQFADLCPLTVGVDIEIGASAWVASGSRRSGARAGIKE